MNIRQASVDDLTAVNQCVQEAFEGYIQRIGKRPASMDRDFLPLIQTACVCVYETLHGVEDTMVLTELDGAIEVSSVSVCPGSQRNGIGRRLMRAAESIAAEKGFHRLVLYTNAALPELSLYCERPGCSPVERRQDEGFDRIFFEKRLDTGV